jgi:photosystem II stability/assembly factor-like uncharacterized protein
MKIKNLVVLFAAVFCSRSGAPAQTWTPGPTNFAYYLGVAMSADGCKLAAVGSGQHAIVSTDSGNTWQTNQASPVYGTCIAASADGSKLATWNLDGGIDGIYVSTNSGGTWVKTNGPTSFNSVASMSLASSANGSVLLESGSGSYLYVSTNSGASWSTGGSPSKTWVSVACSADGTKLIAAATGGIYTSTNFGFAWTATALPAQTWSSLSVACSADGNQLIASGLEGTCVSTNFGGSWSLSLPESGKVASSADGTRLAVAGNFVYTSGDSGVTWMTNSGPESCTFIASSADGCELVAGVQLGGPFGIGLWIGRFVPAPRIAFASSNGNVALSWTIPSTNFVLQQNSDLTTTNWSGVTATPRLNLTNLQDQVALPLSAAAAFFRLAAP